MEGHNEIGEAARRVLDASRGDLEILRQSQLAPEALRQHILRAANVVDRSLRRLLRDDEAADLQLRLQALAPDELRSDAVLAELRRNDRLPVETAAAVHELFEIRRRLEVEPVPLAGDRDRALRAADSLALALSRPISAAAASRPAPPPQSALPDDEVAEPLATAPPRRRGLAAVPLWAGIGAVAALLTVLALVFWSRRGPDHMAQGIALFESGEYTEAAHHFWRYAEANERDATPHLYLASIHRRMNRPELAAESIREAQRLAPGDAAVHRELGFLLLETGQPEVAVDRFRRSLEIDETSSAGWLGLVRALRAAGRDEEAAQAITEAPAEVRALLGGEGGS